MFVPIKGASREKIDRILSKIKRRKKFKANKHLGKHKFPADALLLRKKVRNEWQ